MFCVDCIGRAICEGGIWAEAAGGHGKMAGGQTAQNAELKMGIADIGKYDTDSRREIHLCEWGKAWRIV